MVLLLGSIPYIGTHSATHKGEAAFNDPQRALAALAFEARL
jgi:hypothetical protein